MDWVCLHDRERLTAQDGALLCERCGRRYPVDSGLPRFAADADRDDGTRARVPWLDRMRTVLRKDSAEAAAAEACARLGCARPQRTPDWKSLAPFAAGGRVLEIGPGFGDDTVALAARADRVVALAPARVHGAILARRLADDGVANVDVAVVTDPARLPLPDASIDALAVEDLNETGYEITRPTLDAVLAEWRRVLAPGGTAFVGLRNPLDRTSALRGARALIQSRRAPEPFNRRLRRAGGPAPGGLGPRRVVRALRRHGFAAPAVYAPLPDRDRIEMVIPPDDRRVVRYVLENMLRRNSLAMRTAIAAAEGAVHAGLFARTVPFYFLIVRPEGP